MTDAFVLGDPFKGDKRFHNEIAEVVDRLLPYMQHADDRRLLLSEDNWDYAFVFWYFTTQSGVSGINLGPSPYTGFCRIVKHPPKLRRKYIDIILYSRADVCQDTMRFL